MRSEVIQDANATSTRCILHRCRPIGHSSIASLHHVSFIASSFKAKVNFVPLVVQQKIQRMNRTLWLLLAVVALGGLTAWYFAGGDDKTTLAGADRVFKVEDAGRIGKIFLADRQGNQTTLERKGDHWIVNGDYRARQDAVDNLLDAVTKVEMNYKPANAAIPTMIRSLATEGIKVEVYDRGGELLRAYYVGGAPTDERGTYMLLDGFEQPYVAHIPGWVGNVRFRYNLTGDDWRDRTLFHLQPAEVTEVSIEYPTQRNKSFRLTRQGREWSIAPFYENTPVINRPPGKSAVESFLTLFDGLQSLRFANTAPERPEVESRLPFATVLIRTADGETQSLKLYPRWRDPAMAAENVKDMELPEGSTLDGYFAVTTADDFVVVQDRVVHPVLWAYESFFQ